MAYYSQVMSLKNITDHIYGRDNVITRSDRPNLFIKELYIYIDYLKNKLEESKISMSKKEEKYLRTFTKNMNEGVAYYHHLFSNLKDGFKDIKATVLNELEVGANALHNIHLEIDRLTLVKP